MKTVAVFCPQGNLALANRDEKDKFVPSDENGGQVGYVLEMAKERAKKGDNVVIFARNYDGDETYCESHPDYSNLRIVHIPTEADHTVKKEQFYPYYAEYLAHVAKFVKEEGTEIDSIQGHYTDGMFMTSVFEKFYESLTGKQTPMIGVTHSNALQKTASIATGLDKKTFDEEGILSDEFNAKVDSLNLRIRTAVEIAAIKRMDGIACVSNEHVKILYDDQGYAEGRLPVIPGGVDVSVFKSLVSTATEKLDLRAELLREQQAQGQTLADSSALTEEKIEEITQGKVIFGFGRFNEHKGVHRAVAEMEGILAEHPDTFYVYAGPGLPAEKEEDKAYFDKCMEAAKAGGYQDRILLLPPLKQDKANEWLNSSDVYLHAAGLEPWGLAPQEAAASGVPVVISKYAGASEDLKMPQMALHTRPDVVGDIAKQVGSILRNPSMGRRMSISAVRNIQSNASWEVRQSELQTFEEEVRRYLPERGEINPNAPHARYVAMAEQSLVSLREGIFCDVVKGLAQEMRHIMIDQLHDAAQLETKSNVVSLGRYLREKSGLPAQRAVVK